MNGMELGIQLSVVVDLASTCFTGDGCKVIDDIDEKMKDIKVEGGEENLIDRGSIH